MSANDVIVYLFVETRKPSQKHKGGEISNPLFLKVTLGVRHLQVLKLKHFLRARNYIIYKLKNFKTKKRIQVKNDSCFKNAKKSLKSRNGKSHKYDLKKNL